jgi:serine/threonine-protein kinase
MTEYPEDYPTLSAGPPPVTYSDRVYDYPADPRPSWQTPLAIAGAVLAVIALVVAATAILVRSTVRPDFPPPPPPPPTTVTSMSTSVSTVTLPPPPPAPPRTNTVTVPAPVPSRPQPQSACSQLRAQADADDPYTASQAKGYWVPQLSSKRPGLVADGTTWDCGSILAEHNQLRAAYQADLLWSGDWPNTYHNDDYWVTVAAWTFDTAEGARQWCQDHGRDVPEHCYPNQIR